MAKESTDQETPAPPRRRIVPIGIAVTAGLLAGGGAGALVAGPLLVERTLPAPVAADSSKVEGGGSAGVEADSGSHAGSGEGGTHEPSPIHQLDNLVLNPARSAGTRFLMVSVAFALKDAATVEQMKARDPEVRDVVLGVLGTKTVTELTEVSARDSLKAEIRTRVSPLFGEQAVKQIYFPQFVIQ